MPGRVGAGHRVPRLTGKEGLDIGEACLSYPLRRYHIIAVDDLRRAAERASDYAGPRSTVTKLPTPARTPTEHEQLGRATGENQARG